MLLSVHALQFPQCRRCQAMFHENVFVSGDSLLNNYTRYKYRNTAKDVSRFKVLKTKTWCHMRSSNWLKAAYLEIYGSVQFFLVPAAQCVFRKLPQKEELMILRLNQGQIPTSFYCRKGHYNLYIVNWHFPMILIRSLCIVQTALKGKIALYSQSWSLVAVDTKLPFVWLWSTQYI